MISDDLITLIVIDKFGDGFPAAWCISIHIDTNSLTIFYQTIKANVGEISPP